MSIFKLLVCLFEYYFCKFHLKINTDNYKMCYVDAKHECLTCAIDKS